MNSKLLLVELIPENTNLLTTHLREDSCRNCGKKLQPDSFCSDCNQPYQFQCPHCNHFVDKQIHFGCESIKNFLKRRLFSV